MNISLEFVNVKKIMMFFKKQSIDKIYMNNDEKN